jgi:tetratricopeptide (TPR) repeat protein
MAKENKREDNVEMIENPVTPSTPGAVDEYEKRGWAHYTKKEFYRAEEEFRKALEVDPGSTDVRYAMGMAMQASGRMDEAVKTFEQVIHELQASGDTDPVRAKMVMRLAKGHINRIRTGEWNLGDGI